MASSESFIVPQTYAELQKAYGQHIKKLLIRCNRVETNFEDLHSYVWTKLLEAQILDRFRDHVSQQIPKVLNAVEVCDFLGVSFEQWVEAVTQYHTGADPVWMPTPVNEAEFSIQGIPWFDARNASYSFLDIIRLTWGERIGEEVYWPFEIWGQDVRDGIVVGDSRPEGHLNFPEVRVTQSQFKNYLSKAVRNHYANFCRTQNRRHKERPQSPRGHEGDAVAWENTLLDERQAGAETRIALSEARSLVFATIQSCFVESGIAVDGVTIGKIFAHLEEGSTLPEALRGAGLPGGVQRSIIRSIRTVSGPIEAEKRQCGPRLPVSGTE